MTRMIQIRNVPEDLHRLLKSRAALAGKSLSDYLLEELRRTAMRPTAPWYLEAIGLGQDAAAEFLSALDLKEGSVSDLPQDVYEFSGEGGFADAAHSAQAGDGDAALFAVSEELVQLGGAPGEVGGR